jgi:2-keto-4-pentenoate hydratase
MHPDNARRAADLLTSARTTGKPLVGLTGDLLPADTQDAYAIQDLITASLGPIGGWKTAPARKGVYYNGAPIPASGVYRHGAEIPLAAFPRCELELEIGFTVRSSLPPRKTPYSGEEVAPALGEMCVCLELFSSRYVDRTSRSPMEIVADAQSALGAVIGTGLASWHDFDLARTELALHYAGQTHTGTGGRLVGDVLDACTALANATGRLGGLTAGQVIISGARIGPIHATTAGLISGHISGVGAVTATLV